MDLTGYRPPMSDSFVRLSERTSFFLVFALFAEPAITATDAAYRRFAASDHARKTPQLSLGCFSGGPDRIRTGDLLRDREA
jgi:hypothetical protein